MTESELLTLGWREWLALPTIGLPAIKAKIDTGARTSAIHAFDILPERRDGSDWVKFSVQPLQRNDSLVIRCTAPVVDVRKVTDSGGHAEQRYVVSVGMVLGPINRTIELTLTERRNMLFRMLLGRTALVSDALVDPALSFTCGRLPARSLYSSLASEGAAT